MGIVDPIDSAMLTHGDKPAAAIGYFMDELYPTRKQFATENTKIINLTWINKTPDE
jgi:hypothetical protein